MALKGGERLLVRMADPSPLRRLATRASAVLRGYDLQPLMPFAPRRTLTGTPTPRWLTARPKAGPSGATPWDEAHRAAAAFGYAHYVEPDILHETATAAATAAESERGLDPNWPPPGPVSPGWHLESGFTGFADVRAKATGAGVRIAHLDTGYTPAHASTPKNLDPALAYDFVLGRPGAVDPGGSGLLINPGHGTATLALLAGGEMSLDFQGQGFSGLVGGAPDAVIAPVRIGESVIHLWTSTLAQGLYWALAPCGDPSLRCDVVSLSHGGLPTRLWADAVNALYDAGVVVVAAAGDSIFLELIDIATHFTIYPSAFDRVITALGATYAKAPYKTDVIGQMQGCWGPDDVMDKALAAYTPNIAWMDYAHPPNGFSMRGRGTSSSTPQIAAACALWLQLYGADLPAEPWRRVEACRLALFDSADSRGDKTELGWGLLNVPRLLDADLSARAIAAAASAHPMPPDAVSFALWRLLLGQGPPGSDADRMYETEVAQTVRQSDNPELRAKARLAATIPSTPSDKARARELLLAEGVSAALEARLKETT
ncbi:MAG TPA: S8/S53 family peptidase [Caulobacteraceae bacterium]|jgi:subtilisin family serine protease